MTRVEPAPPAAEDAGLMTRAIGAGLRNPAALGYGALYLTFLILLRFREGFDATEPLLILLIVGVGFSALAWWSTTRAIAHLVSVRRAGSECGVLAGYLLVVVAFTTWGIPTVRGLSDSARVTAVFLLAAKLAVFVAVPLALWSWVWGYRLADFVTLPWKWRGDLRPVLSMSVALLIFQLAFGRGVAEIRQAGITVTQLAIGAPLAYLWLLVEVGVVEEFFFRALLQSRIAAFAHSEVAGVVVMSLIFGLAHAPGLYFRTAATGEGLGSSPSLLMAVGYSVVVTSVTGLFLGILWSRTKSLVLLILIHAAGDLVPNLADMIKMWGAR